MSDVLFIFCFDASLKASQSWDDSSMPAALLQDVPKLPLQFQSCIIQNKAALKRSTEKVFNPPHVVANYCAFWPLGKATYCRTVSEP